MFCLSSPVMKDWFWHFKNWNIVRKKASRVASAVEICAIHHLKKPQGQIVNASVLHPSGNAWEVVWYIVCWCLTLIGDWPPYVCRSALPFWWNHCVVYNLHNMSHSWAQLWYEVLSDRHEYRSILGWPACIVKSIARDLPLQWEHFFWQAWSAIDSNTPKARPLRGSLLGDILGSLPVSTQVFL